MRNAACGAGAASGEMPSRFELEGVAAAVLVEGVAAAVLRGEAAVVVEGVAAVLVSGLPLPMPVAVLVNGLPLPMPVARPEVEAGAVAGASRPLVAVSGAAALPDATSDGPAAALDGPAAALDTALEGLAAFAAPVPVVAPVPTVPAAVEVPPVVAVTGAAATPVVPASGAPERLVPGRLVRLVVPAPTPDVVTDCAANPPTQRLSRYIILYDTKKCACAGRSARAAEFHSFRVVQDRSKSVQRRQRALTMSLGGSQ